MKKFARLIIKTIVITLVVMLTFIAAMFGIGMLLGNYAEDNCVEIDGQYLCQ